LHLIRRHLGRNGSRLRSRHYLARTFPVVVTATSNGVQHQVTLTLIVD